MAVGMDDLDNDIKRTIDDAVDEAESLPFRYINEQGSVCQLCHSYSKKPESLAKGSNMSLLQLIILGLCFGMFFIGYKIGHRDGYIVGRKAVRKHYEQLDQVRV